MTVQQVGADGVALTLGRDELGGCNWDQIGPDQARRWVLSAFAELGLTTGAALQIEAFAGADEVMLLARAVWPRRYHRFESFEDLLSLAMALHRAHRATPDSDLYLYEGQYIVALEGDIPTLAEYATPWPDHLAARLSEYGKLLIERNALTRLADVFSQEKR